MKRLFLLWAFLVLGVSHSYHSNPESFFGHLVAVVSGWVFVPAEILSRSMGYIEVEKCDGRKGTRL